MVALFQGGEGVLRIFDLVYIQAIVNLCGILFHMVLLSSSEMGMSVC